MLKSCVRQRTSYILYQESRSETDCFFDDACYEFFLNRAYNCLSAFHLELHTYCLLPGKVLLLTTSPSSHALRRFIQCVQSAYGEYFRNRFDRASPLLNSRIIRLADDHEPLRLQIFIEQTPVREQLVKLPGEYPWSGYRRFAYGSQKLHLSMHSRLKTLLRGKPNRWQVYRDLLGEPLDDGELQRIGESIGFVIADNEPKANRIDSEAA